MGEGCHRALYRRNPPEAGNLKTLTAEGGATDTYQTLRQSVPTCIKYTPIWDGL